MLPVLIRSVRGAGSEHPVALAAIKALANLALSDAAKDAIRESWGLPVIVECLRSTSTDAASAAASALANLARVSAGPYTRSRHGNLFSY
jgi:hypothetical protein